MADPKEVQKIFRLSEEEDGKLPQLIDLAFKRGYIPKATFEQYMYFAMNCALAYQMQNHKRRRGFPFTCFACGSEFK
jgi:hypothetical protein